MSFDKPLEFFFDRSLGKRSAQPLLEAGWTVHLISAHYANDASKIPDTEWIAEGCRRDWVLLTKDQKIRYRSQELGSLDGQLFCLASGNLGFNEMAQRFLAAGSANARTVASGDRGFWLVYEEGRVEKRWP